MKARLLRKLLNNTEYRISNHKDYIAIGSALCHDLIKFDKRTFAIKYALDTLKEGRVSLESDGKSELLFIWDKLRELTTTDQMHDIINGKDEIKNPLPVFTVNNDGELIESITDQYGYPNTDDDGNCMYDNTHFKTKAEALVYGINESKCDIKILRRRIGTLNAELQEAQNRLRAENAIVAKLKKLLENEK